MNESNPLNARIDPHVIGGEDLAHSPGHLLDDHLRCVGELAATLAAPALRELARLAGIWHDLGKRRPGFQKYIRQAGGIDAHIEGRVPDRDKTHSAAGARWAEVYLTEAFGNAGRLISRCVQYVIAGHHAGLADWQGSLSVRLSGDDARAEYEQSVARPMREDLLRPPLQGIDPKALTHLFNDLRDGSSRPGRSALWLRMLFSAVVDADFLDTEAYFEPGIATARRSTVSIAALRDAHAAHLGVMATKASGPVNRVRIDVLRQCREKALRLPGVFRLSVPTGGGKTLSSLAFALDHAVAFGKRRVVYAIPYTSIIEQTAEVFRSVFAALGDDVVIEHHSNVDIDEARETHRSRLASENWDAPLIVTTNVQLFESLFARKTSRCRKLHNLADSVIVLDEAQLLPLAFLQPIVDVLRYLVQDFGVTVLLCTATQPVLDGSTSVDPARGLRRGIGPVTEIIDDVPALYAALERVRVNLPASLSIPRSWPEVAEEVAAHDAVLAIVSRRADAAELFRLVRARSESPISGRCWHLSALMCAQHRSDTIADIKKALEARRHALDAGEAAAPVRVVSTQLVEAGVDLDFPVVYRALAGLDAVAQAAGRCNREGRLPDLGQVHVFVPPSRSPPGLLRLARGTCEAVWHDLPADPLGLPLVERYFRRLLHDAPSTDEHGICEMLKLTPDPKELSLPMQLRSAADAFRLIDKDDGATVLVRYRSPNARDDIDVLLGRLARDGPSRWLMRKLQRYSVTLYRHDVIRLVNAGDIEEVPSWPGVYVQREGWEGFYDALLGASVDSGPGDPAMWVC